MAEMFGVVAAAVQLAQTCLGVIELMEKIKGGPVALQRYYEQLEELRSLSDNISHNPLLQTVEVGIHTRTILSALSQNSFEHLLHKSRFRRTIYFLYQDRALASLFDDLEKKKATLSLIISDIQSRTLHTIQTDIKAMSGNRSLWNDDSGIECETQIHTGQNKSYSYSKKSSSSTATSFPQASSSAVPYDRARSRDAILADFDKAMDTVKKYPDRMDASAGLHVGCNAYNGRQINGPVIYGDDALAIEYLTNIPDKKASYFWNNLYGKGDQHNGARITTTGSLNLDTSIRNPAYYVGCEYNPTETEEIRRTLGTQINGPEIHRPGQSNLGKSSPSDRGAGTF